MFDVKHLYSKNKIVILMAPQAGQNIQKAIFPNFISLLQFLWGKT